jgi:A/G-specific adenine glycosylase
MTPFVEILYAWYSQNKRTLPWRENPSPYFVWISEVILQQTRVDQGLDYFLRFTEKWPDLKSLAQATEEEILKMWQGLGYYSRARNLHQCAQQVMERFDGSFPANHESLLKLKGVGVYTAAAIASIAFNLPHAVVDGNVYRVLSRVYGIEVPINKPEGQKIFKHLASELLDSENPGKYNQALMEFGALYCVPKNPDCQNCPLQDLCLSFANKTVASLPVKQGKIVARNRYFYYLVISVETAENNQLYLKKRTEKDIWQNLYDFPLVESSREIGIEELVQSAGFADYLGEASFTVGKTSIVYCHKLTHQTIMARFVEIKLSTKLQNITAKNLFLVSEKELGAYPVPRLIEKYLSLKSI